ncbi:DUF3313 domain-containing protein [Marinihelvus fidelis]|uniref:DUF3313 domain-containing protein n=1 Tax=Marinihelvus fidelis TaxID=2613842 RepID=A0A5N0TGJ4_9GAMM|nr:DUF3313 family protein [Marinihelvus fidelis]KAA9134215.1 DUF3313 domain-containing protein [Marinihelvus fidelis]
MNRIKTLLTVGVVALATSGAALAGKAGEPCEEGMERIDSERFSQMYRLADARLGDYRAVMIEDFDVEFASWWRRQQQRAGNFVKRSEMDEFTTEMAQLATEVFEERFRSMGFEVVDHVDEGVLRVTPKIVDLNFIVPDAGWTKYTTVRSGSSGDMTLEATITDSVTGQLLATVRDQQVDREPGNTIRNTATTRKVAARMMDRWAEDLGAELSG